MEQRGKCERCGLEWSGYPLIDKLLGWQSDGCGRFKPARYCKRCRRREGYMVK